MLMDCDVCPVRADCYELQHCARDKSYFADYPAPADKPPVTGKPVIRKDLLEAIVAVLNNESAPLSVVQAILIEDGYITQSEHNICAVIDGKARCTQCGDNGERAKIDASGRCAYCAKHNH